MANFSLEDLATSAGSNTGDFLKDSANQAANFACGIYQKYPKWTIDPLYATTGISTPIAQFKKGLWDKLCSPTGRPTLPAPPAPPFTGGQCDRVMYEIYFVFKVSFSFGDRYESHYFYVWGATTSIQFASRPDPDVPGHYRVGLEVVCHGETHPNNLLPYGEVQTVFKWLTRLNFDHNDPRITEEQFTIKRADNQPDNCGNPPSDYSRTTPQPRELTQNITIIQNNQNITFPITFNSNPTINIPISIKSTDPQTGQSFTINFNFDGVHFDFGGGNQGEGQNTTPDSDNINDLKDTTNRTNDKITETSNDVKKIAEALELKLVGVINAQPCGKSVVEYKYEGKTFVGLQAQINSLANMLARVHEDICLISAKTTETDSALLEQLYDNVTTIGNNLSNLDKFLHSIGLDTLNNRIVTIVQIVSTLSNDSSNLDLLEQLYDNITALNAFLRTIGLESLHNRLVTLSQIVSSGREGSKANNDALEEILLRLGTSDFPITVPASIIETTDELGISIPIGTEVIESIPQFLVWLFHRTDEVFGQWSIPIEIKDTDPTTPGDQSKIMKFPNMAEAMAELLQIALQLSINSELHSNLTTRILMEAGQDKQQNLITYHLLQSLTDYIGYSYKDKIVELPLLFDPTAGSFAQMLTEIKIKVGVAEFDEKLNLQADLMRFRKAASILDSVYFRKIDTNGDIKSQLMERLFGLRDLLKDINPEDNSDDFEKFLEEVEKGFTSTPGVGDPTRPYGDDYENRPRFRDLTEEQNPNI